MARYCRRCGYENGGPLLTSTQRVILTVLLGIWFSSAFIAYPIQTVAFGLLTAGPYVGWREWQRHKALQARFDYEGEPNDGYPYA